MKKTFFKKLLAILDEIELQGVTLHDAPLYVYEELANDYYGFKLPQIREIICFLHEKGALREGNNGMDLKPAPTIYAKSNQNSPLEALSLLETFFSNEALRVFLTRQIQHNSFFPRKNLESILDAHVFSLLLQTILFETKGELLRLQPRLTVWIKDMLREYQEEPFPLISITLTALFAASIVAHEDMRIDYKNTKLHMIDYRYKDTIYSIIPRRGIPHDRDETKALQAFYKDTLFHEFDHACPLCGINIPHMLIASHIKPFRDCAHLFEAIDHSNGLLLCRNHDYLFDQGYFTFDEKGYILFSQELLERSALEQTYALRKNFRLSEAFLTHDRKLFLAYHRSHIFKDGNAALK